jgi:hypothetical protein
MEEEKKKATKKQKAKSKKQKANNYKHARIHTRQYILKPQKNRNHDDA